jgi:hypothetical protein
MAAESYFELVEGMSAAFPIKSGLTRRLEGSGGRVAVTLWNYMGQEIVSRIAKRQKSGTAFA